MSDSRSPAPTVRLTAAPTVANLPSTLTTAIAAGGRAFLPRQRWFGDKARAIAGVEPRDAAVASVADGWLAPAIVAVAFADGGAARYFVPLAVARPPAPDPAVIARLVTPAGDWLVIDACAAPGFPIWLLDQLANGTTLPAEAGVVIARAGAKLPTYLPRARTEVARVTGAEQSNSSIRYGDTLLLKLFRKLQPGENPDLEVGRFLTERTTFRNLPPLLGELVYQPDVAEPMSLAMLQPFVASLGDAWAWVLTRLRGLIAGDVGAETTVLAAGRRLGVRTGELHLALASDPTAPAFAPEPITAADTAGWTAALTAALTDTIAALRSRQDSLPAVWRPAVAALDPATRFSTRDGFAHLVGTAKTRVHGDYHLGQVLVTPDEDFVILDFEGEPARPVAERRAKTSPLKDVAGMLRSFGYARATAQRLPEAAAPDIQQQLLGWEVAMRAAFLAGYRVATVGAPFLPPDEANLTAALAAWELDKVVYEVTYELNNRPDWLDLPLGALVTSSP